MSNIYRGHAIDASYQISDQLALRFQRRRLKCEKLMDRRRTPSDGKSSHCLWQGELKIEDPIWVSLSIQEDKVLVYHISFNMDYS